MAEYIDIDAPVVVTDTRGRERETTVRHILEMNKGVYTAADVRPVVRGKWIGNKRHQSCSECHMAYCVPDGQDGELDMTAYHFCPHCGAWMEES